jgi:hypothetical protein
MYKLLLILLLALGVTAAGAAQDATETPTEPTAFLRALSLIPNTPAIREATPVFSYADYHAALAARGMAVPESLSGYLEGGEVEGPLFPSLPPAGPSNMLQYLVSGGPDYPQTVGFDFFQTAQAVEIGTPPSAGQILIGDFDTAMIRAAYALRGYTAEREDELGTLLCPSAGCEEGARQNLREINPGNPFGGHLGRSEPIFVGDGVLLNSPDDTLVDAMADAYAGSAPSLADAPEFQAIANMLAEYPHVSAVIAVSPLALGQIDPVAITRSPEIAERLMAGIEAEPLAPYAAAAFVSAADETNEYGLALVVYTNAEAAQDAAGVIGHRLETLESLRTGQTYADILNDAGILESAQVVTDEATGLSVVVVRVTGELPPNEEVDGQMIWSHRIFQRFTQMIYARDANWLVWGGEEQP